MDLLREAVGRGVGRGVGSLGASALWLLRDLWALVCVLPRPFSVKLFIGLLWSGGKILFPVGKCFALTVEYIQGDCCSWWCFLVFLSFMSEIVPSPTKTLAS